MEEDEIEQFKNYLRNNPNIMRDEKDGKFFSYEFRPTNITMPCWIFKAVRRKDEVTEYTIMLMPHRIDDEFSPDGSEPKSRKNPEELRREVVLKINHRTEDHDIKVVVEQGSDNKGNDTIFGPHFNWSGENDDDPENEEYVDCEKCRDYFYDLINHFEAIFEGIDDEEVGEFYKGNIDWEKTLLEFKQEIKDSQIAEDYSCEFRIPGL